MGMRVASPVFVGRSEELAALDAALAGAAAGAPGIVLVGGDAGIGKTRLVEAFGERARATGALVLTGGSIKVGHDGLPYGPLVEALRRLVSQADAATLDTALGPARSDLARLLPELGDGADAGPPGVEGADQARLFELLLGVVGRLGRLQLTVLVLEDLHWVDRATKDLLAYLARNLSTEAVLTVATYRSDELGPGDPLLRFLAELRRSARVTHIALGPLDSEETLEQLAAILGERPAPALAAEIHRRSEGNAFYTEELLAASRGDAEPHLPSTLQTILLARVRDAGPEARGLVRFAAVAGRGVDERAYAAVAGVPEDDAVAPLREAIELQLLTRDPGGTHRLRHALLQEAVYGDMLPAERRSLHARFAAALEAHPEVRPASPVAAAAELAHHWAAAGRRPQALRAALHAADEAESVFAFGQAASQYRRAIELWRLVEPTERPMDVDEVALLQRAADASSLAGDVPDAIDLLRRALETIDDAAEPARAAVLRGRLGYLLWGAGGDTEAAMSAHREALRLLPADAPGSERARILVGLAAALMGAGRYRESAGYARDAIASAQAIEENEPIARAHEARARNVLGSDLCALGDVERGLTELRQALRIATEVGRPEARVVAHHNLALNLRFADQLDESLDVALQGVAATAELGLERRFGSDLRAVAADVLFMLGRWDEAETLLREALELRDPSSATYPAAVLGRLRVARGSFDEGERLLRDATAGAVDPDMRAYAFGAAAELAIWQGRLQDARRLVETGVHSVADSDDALLAAPLYTIGMRAEAERAEHARARRDGSLQADAREGAAALRALGETLATQAVESRSPRTSARAELGEAAAERLRLEDDHRTTEWRAVGDAWHRLGMPYRTAYARFREAEAHLRSGGARSGADAALQEAYDMASRLRAAPLADEIEALARRARIELRDRVPPGLEGMVSTTATAESGPSPVPEVHDLGLSPRELEVLALVAAGRTNNQIAAELFISPKTAGVHVTHILDKLAVGNRVEAAMVAARLGLVGNGTSTSG